MRHILLLAAAGGLGFAPVAQAQTPYHRTVEVIEMPDRPPEERDPSGAVGGGAIPALPLEVRNEGGIQYISGGVGDEEREQLKAFAGEYNLQVMLSAKSGAFVAGAMLRVLDAGGKEILSAGNAGPFVYIKLPPGSYALEAVRNGETRTAKINVPEKGAAKAHVGFRE